MYTPSEDKAALDRLAADMDRLKPGAAGEFPPVVLGCKGYETDAAGKAIEAPPSLERHAVALDALIQTAEVLVGSLDGTPGTMPRTFEVIERAKRALAEMRGGS